MKTKSVGMMGAVAAVVVVVVVRRVLMDVVLLKAPVVMAFVRLIKARTALPVKRTVHVLVIACALMENALLKLTTVVMGSVRLKRERIVHPVQRTVHVLQGQHVNQMVNACLLTTVVMGSVRNPLERTVQVVRRTVHVKNMRCVFREIVSHLRFVGMENAILNLWRTARYVQVTVIAMPMRSALKAFAVNQNVRIKNADRMVVVVVVVFVQRGQAVKMAGVLPQGNVVMEGV